MSIDSLGVPIFGSCRIAAPPTLRRHLLWTWEDGVFAAVTLIAFLLPHRAAIFHAYTMTVIILVLSLTYRRGLMVGSVRIGVLATALVLLHRVEGFSGMPLAEVGGLALCGLISGGVGEMQRRAHDALHRSFSQTVEVLARALECRDPYTEGHSRRVAGYAVAIARQMGCQEDFLTVLEQAGLLHDLGKIGVPDAVLRKTGVLTLEEDKQMKRHPEEGSRILADIPSLAKAANLVLHHHEHYDGSGYPGGMAGDVIPLAARILTVADAFDALTTDRPYRKGTSGAEAVETIQQNAGHLFDPAVVDVLQRLQPNLMP